MLRDFAQMLEICNNRLELVVIKTNTCIVELYGAICSCVGFVGAFAKKLFQVFLLIPAIICCLSSSARVLVDDAFTTPW